MKQKKHNDLATVSRNIFITGIGILFQRFSKFFIIILQIKYLGLESYGLFVLCLSYILILSTLQTMGLRCLVKYCVEFRMAKQAEALWAMYWTSIVVPVLAGTIVSAIAAIVVLFLNLSLTTTYVFMFFLLFLPLIGSADLSLFMTTSFETNFYISFGRDIVSPIIEIVLLCIFLFFPIVPSSIYVVICTYATSRIALYFIAAYSFSKLCSLNDIPSYAGYKNIRLLHAHAREVKNAVTYCIPFLGGNIFVQANDLIDVLLLGMFTNNTLTGIYRLSKSLANIIGSVNAITLNMLPSITSKHYQTKNYAAIHTVYLHSIKLSMLLGFPALAVFISFPELILKIFNEEAMQASVSMQILLLGQGFFLLTCGFNLILSMTDKAYLHAFNSACGAVINVILGYFFIHLWNINGAALATICTLFFVNILRALQVYYFYKIHFFHRFTLVMIVLLFSTITMLFFAKNTFAVGIIIAIFLGALCYLFIWSICWFFVLSKKEKQHIISF
ncbi:oligosaccharide flippase family protein [Candidatus Uabimicrobium amorphum]|uniref:Uncharacterized protein n=1 Tax=Uabimicrobium amorphum TaxID=2596890 RepID=A0A5S9F139_UABAM|nr:polysaccharide biosynthesis C-terminal domain-containing protein [Candidatus Uabimicrobium amorphum]BBM81693.1 hypothetical protein UABAM_00032 [Candidatus Uabimicrobium amorphum]